MTQCCAAQTMGCHPRGRLSDTGSMHGLPDRQVVALRRLATVYWHGGPRTLPVTGS